MANVSDPDLNTEPEQVENVNKIVEQLNAMELLESLEGRVEDVEREAQVLSEVVQRVTESLAKRTARSAHVTVAHVSGTSDLAQAAVSRLEHLQQTTNVFFQEIQGVKEHFEIFRILAAKTADVRMQVLRLETQVTKLVLAKSQ